jgi:hypothetical protein
LVDFNKEFLRISRKLLGKPEKGFVVTDFHYTNCGWTKKEVERVINWMKHTENFWRTLERLPNTNQLSKRVKDLNVFYITARFASDGIPVSYQSEDWLREQFGIPDPFVIVEADKAKEAKLLDLDYFIDDRDINCKAVADALPGCKVSIVDQSWNKKFKDSRIKRVESINAWLKTIPELRKS